MKNFRIKYLILIILFYNNTSAQDHPEKSAKKAGTEKIINSVKDNVSVKNILTNIERIRETNSKFNKEVSFRENTFRYFQNKKAEKYSFDLLSSVGRNINFGGVWEKNAVMNFSPSMFIQPADFINIYANYRLSSFIPLTDFNANKTQMKSFVIQSLTVMAVDNSIKLLINSDSWISGLIEYAIKNLIIYSFIKPAVKSNNEHTIPWAEDEYYYYYLSIRF